MGTRIKAGSGICSYCKVSYILRGRETAVICHMKHIVAVMYFTTIYMLIHLAQNTL